MQHTPFFGPTHGNGSTVSPIVDCSWTGRWLGITALWDPKPPQPEDKEIECDKKQEAFELPACDGHKKYTCGSLAAKWMLALLFRDGEAVLVRLGVLVSAFFLVVLVYICIIRIFLVDHCGHDPSISFHCRWRWYRPVLLIPIPFLVDQFPTFQGKRQILLDFNKKPQFCSFSIAGCLPESAKELLKSEVTTLTAMLRRRHQACHIERKTWLLFP